RFFHRRARHCSSTNLPKQDPSEEEYRLQHLGPSSPPAEWIRHGPDPLEVGHPVPISFVLGRTDRASVALTGFISYSNGFRFAMVIALRKPEEGVNPLRQLSDEKRAALTGHRTTPIRRGF